MKNVTLARPSNGEGSDHLFTRDEGNAIPPSCVRGSDKDPVEITRPYSLPCRFDLYGIPYTALGSSVEGNDLWMSGYNNGFANKNLTKVSQIIAMLLL